jgi:hypothetical protein
MKYLITTALILTSLSSFANEAAPAANPCEAKQAEIRKELEMAKQHGNKDKISGLETALAENTKNCTPAKLDAKQDEKTKRLQEKVDKRAEELKKAEASGKTKKIEKAKKKLEQAEQALKAAQ